LLQDKELDEIMRRALAVSPYATRVCDQSLTTAQ